MFLKKILCATLAGAMILSLAACGGGQTEGSAQASEPAADSSPASESAEPAESASADSTGTGDEDLSGVTLEFWNGFTGSDGVVLTDFVNRFNESNEYGITINMDIIPWDNFQQKLPQSIATGTGPDFILNGYEQLAIYLEADTYQPMTDYFELGAVPKENFSQAALDLFVIDGVQWQMPKVTYGRAYYYWNKDVFAAAGLDPEKPGETWDEVIEIAKKVTNPETGVYGLGVPIRDHTLIHHMMLGEGYAWFDETTNTGNLSKPEAQAAMKKLQDAIASDKISPPSVTGPEMDNMAFAGQIAQFFNGPWMVNGYRENEINFGATVVAAGSKGKQGTFEGSGFAVLKDTPELNKKAVYKYLDFYYSDEMSTEWALKNGFPPFLYSVAENSEVKADAIVSEFTKALDYAQPHFVGYKTIPTITEDVLNPLFENIFYGGADIAAETAKADEAMNEILKQEG